jgi:hypothetical protein
VEVRLQRETDYVGFGTEACTDRGLKMILRFDSADLIQVVASWSRCVLDRDVPLKAFRTLPVIGHDQFTSHIHFAVPQYETCTAEIAWFIKFKLWSLSSFVLMSLKLPQ